MSTAAYRAAHRAEDRERSAAYYAAHREEKKAYDAAYRAVHREEKKVYNTAYHAAHWKARYAALSPLERARLLTRKALQRSNRRLNELERSLA